MATAPDSCTVNAGRPLSVGIAWCCPDAENVPSKLRHAPGSGARCEGAGAWAAMAAAATSAAAMMVMTIFMTLPRSDGRPWPVMAAGLSTSAICSSLRIFFSRMSSMMPRPVFMASAASSVDFVVPDHGIEGRDVPML